MIEVELLRSSREHSARIAAEIERQEALAASDIERYGYGDREYARRRWNEFSMTVEPLRRELHAVVKVMADYYGLQPQILDHGQASLDPPKGAR